MIKYRGMPSSEVSMNIEWAQQWSKSQNQNLIAMQVADTTDGDFEEN